MNALAYAFPAAAYVPPADRWFVLMVEPGRDSRALFYLDRQGFEARCLKIKQRVSRRNPLVAPVLMFPGYLFIKMDGHNPRWRRVLSTFSVLDVLRLDKQPAALPVDVEVELFSKIEEVKKGVALVSMGGPEGHEAPTFPPGTQVKVTDGPFTSFPGTFLSRSAKDRVRVLVSIFGRDTETELDETQIEPIDDGLRRTYKGWDSR